MGNPTPLPPDPKLQIVASEIQTISGLATAILQVIPATASVAPLAGLLSLMVSKAISAYSLGMGVEVTPESILKLLPDQTPLVPPKS